jgi:hypothetical protein
MEERIMLSGKPFKIAMKIIDYSIKIVAAVILGVKYYLHGYPKKAFVFHVMVWSLTGFLSSHNKSTHRMKLGPV